MIDFVNKSFIKMHQDDEYAKIASELLINGETIIGAFKSMRDGVIFTSLRLISVNVQGLTGKKKDFTSIPYSSVQCFSVETAGTFDLDSELEIYVSSIGKIKFEFTGSSNVKEISTYIATRALK